MRTMRKISFIRALIIWKRVLFHFAPAYFKLALKGQLIWGMNTAEEIDSFYAAEYREVRHRAIISKRVWALIQSWKHK